MATTEEKPVVDTQKIMIRDSKHTTNKSHQITERAGDEQSNKGTTKQSEKTKMTIVNPYLIILTLNVNGLNSLIKRYTMAVWI